MAADFYLLTSLPTLGELGSTPPMTLRELMDRVGSNAAAARLVEALLLGDDLLSREALLAGEVSEVRPLVLSLGQMRDEAPLGDYLLPAEAAPRLASDSIWAAYYRHADRVARAARSRLLGQWVRFEVGLRNALVLARAAALGLAGEDYLVAPELGLADWDYAPAVAEWAAAGDPYQGLRRLDQARWAWLAGHDAYFEFTHDELVAYAARLMLLHRWARLANGHIAEPSGRDNRP